MLGGICPTPVVVKMNDKKNPHQDFVNDRPSDDEEIIELTEEIIPQTEKIPTLELDEELLNAEPEDNLLSDRNDLKTEHADAVDEDELIASAIEESLEFDADGELPDLASQLGIDLDKEDEQENMAPLAEDLEIDEPGHEQEDSVISRENLEQTAAAHIEDEIIEITEFDEYFPDDDDSAPDTGEVLELTDDQGDDFIELLDVEEEETAVDEKAADFEKRSTETMDDGIDRFFSEAIEDEIALTGDGSGSLEEPPVAGLSEDRPPGDSSMPRQAMAPEFLPDKEPAENVLFEETVSPDEQKAPGTPVSESAVAAPEAASLAGDNYDDRPSPADAAVAAPIIANLSIDQIEAAVERVIDQKFSGRIENIIYDVIEKAVSREIQRLKENLLQKAGPADAADSSID